MKKITHEEVKNYYTDNGCELLISENEYKNVSTPMVYICNCGNKSMISFNNFKKGHRCKDCGTNKRSNLLSKDFSIIKKSFDKIGYKILIKEYEYKNGKTKIPYLCICGKENKISWFGLRNKIKKINKNINVNICTHKYKLTFIDIYNYFLDQCCELLETEYTNSRTKMNYICSCGTISITTWSSFKRGKRCKKCGIYNRTGENNSRYLDDRTREKRSNYLKFDLYHINLLNDDINYKSYLSNKSNYNIDHIYPRIAFIDNDLDSIYGDKFIQKICNLRENVRIILKEENKNKGGKYNQEEFMDWFNNKIKEFK